MWAGPFRTKPQISPIAQIPPMCIGSSTSVLPEICVICGICSSRDVAAAPDGSADEGVVEDEERRQESRSGDERQLRDTPVLARLAVQDGLARIE